MPKFKTDFLHSWMTNFILPQTNILTGSIRLILLILKFHIIWLRFFRPHSSSFVLMVIENARQATKYLIKYSINESYTTFFQLPVKPKHVAFECKATRLKVSTRFMNLLGQTTSLLREYKSCFTCNCVF
jgi:hypothetical protein